jgi:ABC-type branched-subunit amino acid transport system ATPase component
LTASIGRTSLLEVRGLRKDYGGVHAVTGSSFAVPDGGITGLIGPNGAGKSTVLGMIAGAIRPTAGSVVFDGSHIEGKPPYQLARQGLVRTFQIAGVFDRLTVLENLLVGQPMRGESLRGALLGKRYWREEQAAAVGRGRDLLGRFELTEKEDEYAGNLSGGQKRLLEIARALMARPRLLLLDEPMAGVNPVLVRRIEDYLRELSAEGLTMLMVEHSLPVVERLCDPVVVMAQGRTVSTGTMAELRSRREVLDAYLIG